METAWRTKLEAGEVVLVDGGTGSELQRRGVTMSDAAWSGIAAYTHKDELREIHADYVRAGAEVITTNTFGTTRFVLEAAGLGDEYRKINRLAIEAAIEGRDASAEDSVAIAGSISCLPPANDVARYPGETKERDGYRELADTLAEGGVDLIALEMMEDAQHAIMAAEAARETGLPVWLGVSCRFATDDSSLVGFDYPDLPFSEILQALLPFQPDAVNVMHTDPDAIAAALDAVATQWPGAIGVYPELGDFQMPNWNFTSRLTPADLATRTQEWVGLGARLVGGCCGTSPEHIRALRDALPDLRAARQTRD